MNVIPLWRLMFLLSLSMASVSAVAEILADEPPKERIPKERIRAEQAFQDSLQEAKKYLFSYPSRESPDPKIQVKPILRWSNPVVGTIHGNVFVWTRNGRPEVVASIYRFFEPYVEFSAEFHSLSRQRFVAEREGKAVWTTSAAGVAYKRLMGAPHAATTRLGRLRQMCAMAQEFKAVQIDIDAVKRTLRLLPQPAFRYGENAGDQQFDGAMFAFVLGTDPEVFLLLEVRGGDWYYGLTRMCISAAEVVRNDKVIWKMSALEESGYRDRKEPYSIFTLERE